MTLTVRRSEVERLRWKVLLVRHRKTHRVIGLRVLKTVMIWGSR